MDFKNAECIWDALNDLHKNDKEAYQKFIKKHMNTIQANVVIKPKYVLCVQTNVEKVTIRTSSKEYKENVCNYFVFIYYTSKMKAPVLEDNFINNVDKINMDNIYISIAKTEGESSKDMYAEAVVHTLIYKNMENNNFKNKIILRILQLLNYYENKLNRDLYINTKNYKIIDLHYIPKTKHSLNSHCVNENIKKEDNNTQSIDESDIKFFNLLNQKQNKNDHDKNKNKKEIKILQENKDLLNHIESVKTTKKEKDETNNIHNYIPKQIKSYHHTIIDSFLHIIVTFNNIIYDSLQVLKLKNQVHIYVSDTYGDCMTLNFKEKLSDNVKAYFNEKLLKLTISIEILY
ncbi:conserved Plasmodium protein, unknown function [Plasmodium reichenowi]|uniref:PIH1 domain-containing protein n=2 Tax=Plasmodium reichenowi TaxID=5854 RepID=A0A060RY72_PLARE|nr:conserved Plasmodium protein, unknown function [Plasmodium reichenowi]SOV79698.1 conserved Plasmodium protein, unknown function [Plasmodium reichenowi]